MTHTYGEIPDEARAKPFYPLGEHLWRLYQKVGWSYLDYSLEKFPAVIYDLMKRRLDETIMTAREVLSGKIPNPSAVLAYMLYPPTVTIRTDLQQGVMKLMYGESCDVSFVALHDNNAEIYALLNAHCEDGIPVDWWIIGPDDELLERRHLKLGLKLKDIPVKIKNLKKAGYKVIDVLNDVRNERTPQWMNSTYHAAVAIGCAATNMLNCTTNYELWGAVWDGVSAKSYYKTPDDLWVFLPTPPLISTLTLMGRSEMTLKMIGLTHRAKLNILGVEREIYDYFERELPETTEYIRETYQSRIWLPKSTLNCQPPDLMDKKTFKNEEFDWQYEGRNINPEDLKLSIDEILEGVFLDVDHEYPIDQKVDESKIFSMGLGRTTKFFREVTDSDL